MKLFFQKVACALTVAGVLPAASASVLTFDDLSGTDFFTSNYNGFMFGDNSAITNPWFYTDVTTEYNIPFSPPTFVATDNRLYARDGTYEPTLPIYNATPFVFNGAYFSDAPSFENPDRISYQLYLQGVLVYTSGLSGNLGAAPTFVASGYDGLVNSVVISGQQGYYAMDNFTYNSVAAVPEPGTYALMIAGLVALAAASRRRIA